MLPKILVVDDDRYTRTLIEQLMRKTAEVHLAEEGTAARRLFADMDFNLVLMDQRLPHDKGLDLLREFRSHKPRLVAILITGYADVHEAVAAVREGLFDYLSKPFEDLEALEAAIGKALELDRAYREIDSLRSRLAQESGAPQVVGQSPAMERLLGQIREVAGLDTTVLLEGESGTGKDVIAKLTHALRIAAVCRNLCWKVCCLVTRKGLLPGQIRPRPATLRKLMEVICFWMKLLT
ncbi:MAG: Fis family two component sigma-54 specific transcriptional regulator [Comamonadaceae bacterium]|nr:MAG: Fis family two component sigma-54 specific transcriptional regulator [Comamonadaceae bacterium]